MSGTSTYGKVLGRARVPSWSELGVAGINASRVTELGAKMSKISGKVLKGTTHLRRVKRGTAVSEIVALSTDQHIEAQWGSQPTKSALRAQCQLICSRISVRSNRWNRPEPSCARPNSTMLPSGASSMPCETPASSWSKSGVTMSASHWTKAKQRKLAIVPLPPPPSPAALLTRLGRCLAERASNEGETGHKADVEPGRNDRLRAPARNSARPGVDLGGAVSDEVVNPNLAVSQFFQE